MFEFVFDFYSCRGFYFHYNGTGSTDGWGAKMDV